MPIKRTIKKKSLCKQHPLSSQQRKYATPQAAFRSGLEEVTAKQIAAAGFPVKFEERKLKYDVPASTHTYTPDFQVGDIIIETKGLFSTEDRKKMKLVKEQHPHLDIRMVFSRAMATIAKGSKTTYAKWCDTHGFPWADKRIPMAWFTEAAGLPA